VAKLSRLCKYLYISYTFNQSAIISNIEALTDV